MDFWGDFKSEIKILLIVSAVAVVGTALLFTVLSSSLQPAVSPASQSVPIAPSPQPQVIDTSTWQTYRNAELGFEFQYPEDWRIDREKQNESSFELRIEKASPDFYSAVFFEASPIDQQIVSQYRNDIFPKLVQQYGFESIKEDTVLVDSISFARVYVLTENKEKLIPHLYATKGDTTWFITFDNAGCENRARCNELFDQILSTFRFVD